MVSVSITRFVIWICRKFDRVHVEQIVEELSAILKNPNSSIQPCKPFDKDHPNYRDFKPDVDAPLTAAQLPGKKKPPKRKRTSR